jgi:hypothetical protein
MRSTPAIPIAVEFGLTAGLRRKISERADQMLAGEKIKDFRPKAVTGEPVIEYPTEDINPDDGPF